MTTPPASSIATGTAVATLINVFTVAPENQRLVDLLTEATEAGTWPRPPRPPSASSPTSIG